MQMRWSQLEFKHTGLFLGTIFLSFLNASVHAFGTDVLVITESTVLDPNQTYSQIIIKASNITIDGRGAQLIGASEGTPKSFKSTAISAEGVSGVKLKNLRARGWEIGLRITDGKDWLVEGCDFSDNFHDPDFGWGENGRRGGIVLERVSLSILRNNKANKVWDACVLVNSNKNLIEGNDFSLTSNTCLKLWTSCENTIRKNNLSYGIRIAPSEVHARDSTSVLIESGSCKNELIDNDCTHGGDGIFVRVLNGWCSTDNLFQGNDCSYANNNGIECWAPRNVFIKNKANHCSYGFWMGGSDQTRLIENEASYNGLATGAHNSPHLPNAGHAGIVFMFGSSSHTLARGNVCVGNNGAGIALIGDLASQEAKWRAYHWIIEENQLKDNRWGIYAKHADWITLTGNLFANNAIQNTLMDGDVTRLTESTESLTGYPLLASIRIDGPTSVQMGESAIWKVCPADIPDGTNKSNSIDAKISYIWDLGDGAFRNGNELRYKFERVGLHRLGLNVTDGQRSELAWQNVYVTSNNAEIGTEGDASEWYVQDFEDRKLSSQQTSRAEFEIDTTDRLCGKSSLRVVIQPYRGFRVALSMASESLRQPLQGKTKLTFWLKAINEDTTGWQGGPFITLVDQVGKPYYLEPAKGRDLMRESANSESREGWRLFEIPLAGDEVWQAEGSLPNSVNKISLAFDSWGAPTLRFWLDGLAFE
jgi:parallel beta-helix repeat protein